MKNEKNEKFFKEPLFNVNEGFKDEKSACAEM